jgi:MORN repeat
MRGQFISAISRAERAAAICAVLALATSGAARCAEAGAWILDTSAGCKVWNPHPQPNETMRWSGACPNGMAHGRGAVQWFRGNLPFETDEGEWREGRQTGFGTQVWPTGRYDGELTDGEPNGHGVLIVQGLRYDGELRNGKPNGFGTLTNVSGTFRGTWRDGCLQDQKQKAAFGVPLSAC